MRYATPDTPGSKVRYQSRYGNFIGGEFIPPARGRYYENISPVTGDPFCEIARSSADDVDLALDWAHAAKHGWGQTPAAERSLVLMKIADRLEAELERFAVSESWDSGKPVREALAGDLPLAIDHFRYFAACIRGKEGSLAELDATTVSYQLEEPLGVVGQILPWNFPLLMAAWNLAPALAAGNTVVLKPAEQTPVTILLFAELIADLLPPGVLNVVNGFGAEVGRPLARSDRIAKVTFAGDAGTGRRVLEEAAENIVPVIMELGARSANLFFADVMDEDDAFRQKALEGFAMFLLNQGGVGSGPCRALIDTRIYDPFLDLAISRVGAVVPGDPLDTDTKLGAQVSKEQLERLLSYVAVGREEGVKVLLGGERVCLGGELGGGYYVSPTIFEDAHRMRAPREEVFGPVVSVARFDSEVEAVRLANDTSSTLGAGLWTRSVQKAFRVGRAIQAGRVWTNCTDLYRTHAAFAGSRSAGAGLENRRSVLNQYRQTKDLVVSYDENPVGLF